MNDIEIQDFIKIQDEINQIQFDINNHTSDNMLGLLVGVLISLAMSLVALCATLTK